MTRRERHQRILESFGNEWVGKTIRMHFSTKELLEMLSDEGVEKLTRRIIVNYKRQEKYNREARTPRTLHKEHDYVQS